MSGVEDSGEAGEEQVGEPLHYRGLEPGRGISVLGWVSIGLGLAGLGISRFVLGHYWLWRIGRDAIVCATVTGIIVGIVGLYLQSTKPARWFYWVGIVLNLLVILWLQRG